MAHIKAGVRSGQEVQGKIPQEWGTDQLAAFLDLSSDNLLASYVHARQHYDDVARVDAAYVTFTDNLLNPDDLIAPMFFLQAHAAYRSAASLAMSCESAPAFMVMRGCLEHSLYGLYVNRKPDTFDLWLKREDSDETRQLVRNEFRISRLKDCLREADQTTADAADGLYGKTIDFGAHPNVGALNAAYRTRRVADRREVQVLFMTADPAIITGTLKSAQIGVCSLLIFRNAFPERFDLLGITDTLRGLRARL